MEGEGGLGKKNEIRRKRCFFSERPLVASVTNERSWSLIGCLGDQWALLATEFDVGNEAAGGHVADDQSESGVAFRRLRMDQSEDAVRVRFYLRVLFRFLFLFGFFIGNVRLFFCGSLSCAIRSLDPRK